MTPEASAERFAERKPSGSGGARLFRPQGEKATPSRRILNFTTSLRGKRNRPVPLIVLLETSVAG